MQVLTCMMKTGSKFDNSSFSAPGRNIKKISSLLGFQITVKNGTTIGSYRKISLSTVKSFFILK